MNTMKKIQVHKNGCKYILFRIDIYFSECFLAVEIDEKGNTDRDIIFEEKKQKALKKNLVVNLLELIQVMQKMVMIQIMRLVMYKNLLMSSKKKNQKKRKRNKIKRTRRKIRKITKTKIRKRTKTKIRKRTKRNILKRTE